MSTIFSTGSVPYSFNISTAYFELTVVLFPNCPDVFNPQAYTFPSFVNAKQWLNPDDIFTTFVKYVVSFIFTCSGIAIFATVLPIPHCPTSFKPLAHTVPSAFNAIV